MSASCEEACRRLLAQCLLGPDYLLEKYTSRNYLLKDQARMLQEMKAFSSYKYKTTFTLEPNIVLPKTSRINLILENRVRILDLMQSIDIPIKGKFLLCRSISPPVQMSAVVVVADDPEGEFAIRFSIYNVFPQANTEKLTELIPVGSIMAVVNPYFKTSCDGGFGLRTDCPGNLKFLTSFQAKELFPNLVWKKDIPKRYRKTVAKSTPKTADEWKALGNDFFSEKNYFCALDAYNSGLKVDPRSVCLLSNRAATYLQMQAYKLALNDAEAVLQIDLLHVKASYRKAKALLGLKRYKEARAFLNGIVNLNFQESDKNLLVSLQSEIDVYCHQSETGVYDMDHIVKTALNNPSHHFDIADYVGPVEVRDSPGKGRGLFVTENVEAGRLLIASKAFVLHIYDDVNKDSQWDVKVNVVKMAVSEVKRHSNSLATSIARILTNAPEKGNEFYNLYAGPELRFLSSEDGDDTSLVDIKRIEQICLFNSFQTKYGEELIRQPHEGIWLLPSMINHSCFDGNCFWMVLGDFMFIRAAKAISKNNEILISYIEPEYTFGPRLMLFEKRRFVCDCRLCDLDQKESKKTHQKRQRWINDFSSLVLSSDDGVVSEVNFLKNIVNRIGSLRAKNFDLNTHIIAPLLVLSASYEKQRKYDKAIETMEKAYELTKNMTTCMTHIKILADLLRMNLIADSILKANFWLGKLKEMILIMYGSLDVFDALDEVFDLGKLFEEKGFSF